MKPREGAQNRPGTRYQVPEGGGDLAGELLDLVAGLHPDWHAKGLCHGATDLFYPEQGVSSREIRPIKEICARCPVVDLCRQWGIEHEHHGIWGGLTELDRRKIRRAQRIKVTTPGRTRRRQRNAGLPAWRGAPRDCVHCGATYTPRQPNAKYCTPHCAQAAEYARIRDRYAAGGEGVA